MKAMHSIDLSVPYYKGALSYAVFSQNIDVLASREPLSLLLASPDLTFPL